MSIVKMKKLSLIALESEREELFKKLMVLGCVELAPVPIPLDSPVLTRYFSETEDLRTNRTSLFNSVGILDTYIAPPKAKMFSPGPDVAVSDFLDGKYAENLLAIAKDIDISNSDVRRINAELAREESLIASLRPWAEYGLALDCKGTANSVVIIGTVPAINDIEKLSSELGEAIPESELFLVNEDAEQKYLCIMALRDREQEVFDFLRGYGFNYSQLSTRSGTAADNIARSEAQIAALFEQRESYESRIRGYAAQREVLLQAVDFFDSEIARAEAESNLLSSEKTVAMSGWVPVPELDALESLLIQYNCAWELSDPIPDEYPDVPIQLKNNALTEPLTMVTEMYSFPAYDGIDPNPLMMPFFVAFFGIMMADIGYGLLMTIAALVVKRKKPRGGSKNFFDLMLLCGIATIIVGILTGSFFGDLLEQAASLLGYTFTMPFPVLIVPMRDTMPLLVGALVLGGLQIIVGMAISLVMQIRNGHFWDGIFDVIPWWILFAGLGVYYFNHSFVVAIVGAVALILTQGRNAKSIPVKFINGIGSLYNITGYFGDVVSYARLMALMLAGGSIAQAFNMIGAMTGNIVTFLIIAIAGHAINLGLNLISCYVHDLRLQCLEYFGKFYKDGGRAFNPLRINAKYVNIIK